MTPVERALVPERRPLLCSTAQSAIGRCTRIRSSSNRRVAALRIAREGLAQRPPLEAAVSLVVDGVRSVPHFVHLLLFTFADALQIALGVLFVLLLLYLVVKRVWLAVAICVIVVLPITGAGPGELHAWSALTAAAAILEFAVLVRFGFLAFAINMLVFRLVTYVPLTFDMQAWYSGYSFAALSIVITLAAYTAVTASRSEPAIGRVRAAQRGIGVEKT